MRAMWRESSAASTEHWSGSGETQLSASVSGRVAPTAMRGVNHVKRRREQQHPCLYGMGSPAPGQGPGSTAALRQHGMAAWGQRATRMGRNESERPIVFRRPVKSDL